MKKFVSTLLITIILSAIAFTLPVSAATASASLTGSGTVRAGDTITLKFNINGKGITGFEGSLSYDSNVVTYSGMKQVIGSPWDVSMSGTTILAYDDSLEAPINSNKTVLSLTFKVKSVATGTAIRISVSGKASDGTSGVNISSTYSVSVAAPLSTNCNLKSLTVSNATLSPAFSAGTTSYSAGTVEFSVSKLNINAVAEDSKAKVSISGNNLAVGNNTVKIVVKAESGATKTYSIKVTRKQDPNYVPSSNTALSSISVDGFLISPPFQAGVDRYVVWLPYETTSITTKATPADSKASVSITGGTDLVAGSDNTVTITCTAEDGTKKEYYVIAKRAAQDGGEIKPEEPPEEDKSEETNQDEQQEAKGGLNVWVVVALCVLCLLLGALAMFLLVRFNVIRL